MTREVRDAIVAFDPQRIKPGSHDLNRIYAPKVTTRELTEIITKLYKTNVSVIPPRRPGSLSIRFYTFKLIVNGSEISIIHGNGIVPGAAGEAREVQSIQSQIDELGSVSIEVAGQAYHNIVKIEKVPGNKKADFQLLDSKGNAVVFIQHKGPQHQQMTGMTKFDRVKFPEIQEFVERVRAFVNTTKKRLKHPITQLIENPEFSLLATYGTLDGVFSQDAVQLYCVGAITLVKSGDVYKLQASVNTFEYPNQVSDNYQPMLVARYAASRRQEGLSNIRFSIYPKNANFV